jgi:putative transposase
MSPRWEPNPDIRRGRTVIYTLHAHLVFTPKYRRGPFTDEILRRCEEVMRAVCADFETELVEFNGERDHVHLLVHYPPKVSISKLVGSLKGVSARRLRLGAPPGRRLGESTPTTSANTCGARTSGHPRTSRRAVAEHRWPSSRSTSSSKDVRRDLHVRAILRSDSSRA